MISWTTARLVDFSFTSERTQSGSSSFSITGGDVVIDSNGTSTNVTATNTGSFSSSFFQKTTFGATATKTESGSTSTAEEGGTSEGFGSNSFETGTEMSGSGETTLESFTVATSTSVSVFGPRTVTATTLRSTSIRSGTTITTLVGTETQSFPTTQTVALSVSSYTTIISGSSSTTGLSSTTNSVTGETSTLGNVFDTVYSAEPNEIIFFIDSDADANKPVSEYSINEKSFVLSARAETRSMQRVTTTNPQTTDTFLYESRSLSWRNSTTITRTISRLGFSVNEDDDFDTRTWNIPESSTTDTSSAVSFVTASASSQGELLSLVHRGNTDLFTTTIGTETLATRTGFFGNVTFHSVFSFPTTTTSASVHSATFSTSSTTNQTAEFATLAGGSTTTIVPPELAWGPSPPVSAVTRSVFRQTGAYAGNQAGLVLTANKSISGDIRIWGGGGDYRILLPGQRQAYTAENNSVTFTTTTVSEGATINTTDSAVVSVAGQPSAYFANSATRIVGGAAGASETIVNRAQRGAYRRRDTAANTTFFQGNDTVYAGQTQDVSAYEPLRYVVHAVSVQAAVFAVPRNTTTYPS